MRKEIWKSCLFNSGLVGGIFAMSLVFADVLSDIEEMKEMRQESICGAIPGKEIWVVFEMQEGNKEITDAVFIEDNPIGIKFSSSGIETFVPWTSVKYVDIPSFQQRQGDEPEFTPLLPE